MKGIIGDLLFVLGVALVAWGLNEVMGFGIAMVWMGAWTMVTGFGIYVEAKEEREA